MSFDASSRDLCASCPVHLPGRQALSGCLQGALGGLCAGLLRQQVLPHLGLRNIGGPEVILLWASLAGLLGAALGLFLGLAGFSLWSRGRAILAAVLLLGCTGLAVVLLQGRGASPLLTTLAGVTIALPTGLLGRLLIPRPAVSCQLTDSVAEVSSPVHDSLRDSDESIMPEPRSTATPASAVSGYDADSSTP